MCYPDSTDNLLNDLQAWNALSDVIDAMEKSDAQDKVLLKSLREISIKNGDALIQVLDGLIDSLIE